MPTLDLPPAYLHRLLDVIAQQTPDAEIWAYGSRVTGAAHDGSDLDLVLRNPANLEAPHPRLHRLRDALSESDLPILVDVLDWARIPPEFRQEIERRHVVVATVSGAPVAAL